MLAGMIPPNPSEFSISVSEAVIQCRLTIQAPNGLSPRLSADAEHSTGSDADFIPKMH